MSDFQIGVDLGGTKMLLLAAAGQERKVEKILTGPDFTIDDAEKEIRRFVNNCAQPLASIGIAIPGLVNSSGRVVMSDVLPRIEGWMPAVTLGLPVATVVLNDAEAALIGETSSLDPGATAALVIIGTGIGASFLVEGQILRGAKGWAGEFGSIPIRTKSGYVTLDSVSSGAAILKRIGAQPDIISARAQKGDEDILQVFRECGAVLGAGLASIINLFNPSVLVLAGGTLRWPEYLKAALEHARILSMPQLWDSCSIRLSDLGEYLVALGAAHAAVDGERHSK